jgi:putative ABC transport system substrate-binding protein
MARAQQSGNVYRVAYIHPSNPTSAFSEAGGNPFYRAFFEQLRRLGYEEGRNVEITRYSGEGRSEHYEQLAREVVRTRPDVIVTSSNPMVRSFQAASSTIPIVAVTADPLGFGLVASLSRPGGNFTGSSVDTGADIYQKQLEVLKEALPALSTVGLIMRPQQWENPIGLAIRSSAQHLGIAVVLGPLKGFGEADYRDAFEAVVERGVDASLLTEQGEHFTHRQLIVALAETNRLPTVTTFQEIVEIGGLIAYAPDRREPFRYLATCIDKVLRGEHPREIPIYQADKFVLAINLKTAGALGIVIPASLVARADKVIE